MAVMKQIFRWVLAPAGLAVSFVIVENHMEDNTTLVLAAFLSGCTMGLYFGLLLLKRRKRG